MDSFQGMELIPGQEMEKDNANLYVSQRVAQVFIYSFFNETSMRLTIRFTNHHWISTGHSHLGYRQAVSNISDNCIVFPWILYYVIFFNELTILLNNFVTQFIE